MVEMRHLRLGRRGDVCDRICNGDIVLSSPETLQPFNRSYTERLEHWALVAGDRDFVAQRTANGNGWRKISYAKMFSQVRSVAQALLDRGLSQDRPLMILSGNEIEHAVMALAAMHVGIPYSPISLSYSLVSKDFAKLRHCCDLLTPGLVYASNAIQFEHAIKAVISPDIEVAYLSNPIAGRRMVSFDELAATTPTSDVDRAARAVRGEMPARILFTSGSTSMPKGAINTHQVICANQQMTAQVWPFILDAPPIVCDWLPWNHTFGAGQIFGLILWGGGTIYIDEGRPMPGMIDKTVENLKDVRPTFFVNVPKGFEMVLPFLENDKTFRENFFSRLTMLFYSAASLATSVTDAYNRLALETIGKRIFTTTGFGSTETGPLAIMCNWDSPHPGNIGLPAPGVRAKLTPNGSKKEVRIKSPAIVPGYWRQPELTKKVFDDDGWYMIGDAVRFIDPSIPSEGLLFDGRVAEDFKLKTGTWVNVGPLRILATEELTPLVQNVLICGQDRDEVGLVVFPEVEFCRHLAGLDKDASRATILSHPNVLGEFRARLARMAQHGTGSSNRIARMVVAATALADVEVTDKGTLSTNVVLERRKAEIDDLYSTSPSSLVVALYAKVD
jgi:feruloyl-CoA synthase